MFTKKLKYTFIKYRNLIKNYYTLTSMSLYFLHRRPLYRKNEMTRRIYRLSMFIDNKNSIDAMKTILDLQNIDLNRRDGGGRSLIFYVCDDKNGSKENHSHRLTLLKMMLDSQSNRVQIDAMDDNGQTPLMVACRNSTNIEIIKLLLAHNANIDARDADGNTVLISALNNYCCKKKIIAELIKAGSDVNACDNNGYTPLHISTNIYSTKHHVGIINLLITSGANIHQIHNNESIFRMYCRLDDSCASVVNTFIKYGVDVNSQNTYAGYTPLMTVCADHSRDTLEILELLLMSGANPNMCDRDKRTAIMHAAIHGHTLKKFELLIKYGADLDARDKKGKTALMYACQNARYFPERALKLIELGANCLSNNFKNKSVIEYCISGSKRLGLCVDGPDDEAMYYRDDKENETRQLLEILIDRNTDYQSRPKIVKLYHRCKIDLLDATYLARLSGTQVYNNTKSAR